jgi:hypothetical protein
MYIPSLAQNLPGCNKKICEVCHMGNDTPFFDENVPVDYTIVRRSSGREVSSPACNLYILSYPDKEVIHNGRNL